MKRKTMYVIYIYEDHNISLFLTLFTSIYMNKTPTFLKGIN